MTTEPEHNDRHFDALQKAVCAWLRANGVDPADTPRDSGASVTDGGLTLKQWVRHPTTGRLVEDPDRPNELKTRTITVPVKVPPTPLVEEWLAPRCPKCGR